MTRFPSLLLALALLAVLAPLAHADSIAYIKSSNVWIANPDGSGQYQVTRDGTTGDPYTSVAQDDAGRIVATRGKRIYRMKQNGALLNAPIPVATPNKTANPHEVTAPLPDEDSSPPVDVEITPDGTKVAFWFLGRCYRSVGGFFQYVPCPMIGLSYSDRFTAPSEMTRQEANQGRDPYWISNSRYAAAGESSTEIYVDDAPVPDCQPAPSCHTAFWLRNCYGAPETCEGAVDPAVSRSGKRIIVVSQQDTAGYRMIFYESVTGPPPPGNPAPSGSHGEPQPKCLLEAPTGGNFSSPTWSPPGTAAAWTEGDGIHVAPVPDLNNCASIPSSPTATIPGGSDPSWGPADVNPGPREDEPGAGGTDTRAPALKASAKKRQSILSVTRKPGYRVDFVIDERCTLTVAFTISKRNARRFGLGRKQLTLDRGKTSLAAGGYDIKLWASGRNARKLRALARKAGTRKVPAAVAMKCTDGAGNTARRELDVKLVG